MADQFGASTTPWKEMQPRDGDTMRTGNHQNLLCLSNQPNPVDWDDKYFFDNYVATMARKKIPTRDQAVLQQNHS